MVNPVIGYGKSAKPAQKPWYVSECKWWKQIVIPPTGYVDPWTCKDWTHNVSWLYHEKLDWMLVNNCQIIRCGMGGKNTSDHRPLWLDLSLESDRR